MNILLADDDSDDRMFFSQVLDEIPNKSHLETVNNGEELMTFLLNAEQLPDVLFLDLNMPLKNGHECLQEIKQHDKTKLLPVIIYSTSLHEDIANQLYDLGAHYYIRKSSLEELKKTLEYVFVLFPEIKDRQPPRSEFILSNR
jgi:CheY-like chemotaxis protein